VGATGIPQSEIVLLSASTPAGTIDSFTNPAGTSLLSSPDHALQHTNVNTAVNSIETVVGTTLGTNVLKAFATGDIPARITTANVLKQSITGTVGLSAGSITVQLVNTGTVANGVYGTAQHTGGTATAFTIADSASNILANNLKTSTGSVNVGSSAAPSVSQVLTATGASAATWQTAPSVLVQTLGTVYTTVGTFTSNTFVDSSLIGTLTVTTNSRIVMMASVAVSHSTYGEESTLTARMICPSVDKSIKGLV
jgi:hypothetical protein